MPRNLLHKRLGLMPGNYVIESVNVEGWGSRVEVMCLYQYPPDEKYLTLIFENCRSLEWYVQRTATEITQMENAQLLTHDLGEGDYNRTARFATTIIELIISYGKLKIIQEDK